MLGYEVTFNRVQLWLMLKSHINCTLYVTTASFSESSYTISTGIECFIEEHKFSITENTLCTMFVNVQ